MLQRLSEDLRGETRDAALKCDAAEARAACADAARCEAVRDTKSAERNARQALADATTTMTAAANASQSSAQDTHRLRAELESIRHEFFISQRRLE